MEGDLYDGQGDFVGHATWTGSDANAALKFNVAKTQPPYTLEHLNLIQANGPIIDDRYPPAYEITDLAGKIEGSGSDLWSSQQPDESLRWM